MAYSARADLYEVLGIAPNATAHQVDHAFRALVRQHHPDTSTQHDQPNQNDDAHRLQEILAAYAVLRDPAARAAYDRRTKRHVPDDPTPKPHTTTPSPPPRPTTPYRGRSEPPLRAGPVHWTPLKPR